MSSLLLLFFACPPASVTCGDGTHEENGECVPDAALEETGEAVEVETGSESGLVDTGETSLDTGTPDTGVDVPVDVGYPEYPENILTLSVALKTADAEYAGTDGNQLSICITASDCFRMNHADVDDFRRGEMDVYHFDAVGVPRSSVDRIQLRSVNGEDRWEPSCLQVAFDGEPVYCNDALGFYMGEESGETESWADTTIPNNLCDSCDDSRVTHGPILGSTAADDTRIWVRTDATRRVGVYMGQAVDNLQPRGWMYPVPQDDFTAELQVTGLQPDTQYFYQLEVEGQLQAQIHEFRTAPADGQSVTMDLAFVSCTKTDSQPAFASIADEDPDMVLFIGDNHYGDTPEEAALQWNYRWAHSRAHRKELMMDTSTLATWDDHDYVGNNTDGDSLGKLQARLAFEDYWPNPGHGTANTPGVFFSESYGDVDFFFLDDRYYRGQNDSLTGNAQMGWLMSELLASTATFKLLVNGSQWSLEGTSDSWAEFPTARNELMEFIRDQNVDGVVLLSGDVHYSEFRTLSYDGLYDLTEFTSSPAANSTSNCPSDSEQLFCYDNGPSFVTLEIDTDRPDPRIVGRLHLEDGAVWAHHTIWYADLIP